MKDAIDDPARRCQHIRKPSRPVCPSLDSPIRSGGSWLISQVIVQQRPSCSDKTDSNQHRRCSHKGGCRDSKGGDGN